MIYTKPTVALRAMLSVKHAVLIQTLPEAKSSESSGFLGHGVASSVAEKEVGGGSYLPTA